MKSGIYSPSSSTSLTYKDELLLLVSVRGFLDDDVVAVDGCFDGLSFCCFLDVADDAAADGGGADGAGSGGGIN